MQPKSMPTLKNTVDLSQWDAFSAKEIEYLKQNLHLYAYVPSEKISDEQYNFISSRMHKISLCVTQRESYISETGLDNEIFGTHWGREFFDIVTSKLINGDRGMYDRLRLIWNFSGLSIVNYRHVDTFPIVDPVFHRYLKLYSVSPNAFKITAPLICGEAGWKVDDGIVNVDVASTQERLLYLYFTGVYDRLVQKKCPDILEIGAGSGMFAYGLIKSLKRCRYFICDVPESLTMQFSYLNLAMPDVGHYVASPIGLFEILGPNQEDKKVTLESIKEGIIYIPNYMMHLYDETIKPDLIYNAMSLHEMRPKQIEYYCKMMSRALGANDSRFSSLWRKLDSNPGIFGRVWRKIQASQDNLHTLKWKILNLVFRLFRAVCKKIGYRPNEQGIFFEVNAHRGETNNTNQPYLNKNFKYKKSFEFYDLSLGPTVWTNDPVVMGDIDKKFAFYGNKYDLNNLFKIDLPFHYPKAHFPTMQRMMDEDLGNYIGVSLTNWMNERGYFFADHLGGYCRRFLNIHSF